MNRSVISTLPFWRGDGRRSYTNLRPYHLESLEASHSWSMGFRLQVPSFKASVARSLEPPWGPRPRQLRQGEASQLQPVKVPSERHVRRGFPKIGVPNIVPQNSRILIIRTPVVRYPLLSEAPMCRLARSLASSAVHSSTPGLCGISSSQRGTLCTDYGCSQCRVQHSATGAKIKTPSVIQSLGVTSCTLALQPF